MASFIKIQTQTDIDNATGIGKLVNPEKIVTVQSVNGDPTTTLVSFVLSSIPSSATGTGSRTVSVLEIEANIPIASTGFPVTEAMNKAIEIAILTNGAVVDFNAILKGIAVDGVFINSLSINS